jgi:hypothetical protein
MTHKAASAEAPVRSRSFFEPDVLTSHRFFKVYRQKAQWGPEERLMFAVLTDAVECFQKYHGGQSRRARVLFAEAAEWIESRDSSWPFSFEQICQALNLNPSYLRMGLTQWRLSFEKSRPARRRIREPLRYQYHRVKQSRISVAHLAMH